MNNKKYRVIDIVNNLVGKIHPIASAEYDVKCSENIEVYIDIVQEMIDKIKSVSEEASSPYGSAKQVGQKATDFLKSLKDDLSEY